MISAANRKTAYASIDTPVKTPRSVEYETFAQVTRRLARADADRKAPGGFTELAEALHDNQRLWNVLASDVAGERNQLPKELRARLFYLAEFTRLHSRNVLSGAGAAGVLVEINTAVMRGLRERQEAV